MATVTRTYDAQCQVLKVWQYFADVEIWAGWVDVKTFFATRRHKISWAEGRPSPGGHLTLEVNGKPSADWVAREWDPPRRFHVTGGDDPKKPGYFEFALTLTPLSASATHVEFIATVEPGELGFVGSIIKVEDILGKRVDEIIARANNLLK